MDKIRIGILGTSDVAFRRFLPALMKSSDFEYVGVASRDIKKTKIFSDTFGGVGFSGYDSLIESRDIDAIYVPLPPALHYTWGRKVLEHDKHLFMEKPFTINHYDTKKLIELATNMALSIHENYMFVYHKQLEVIHDIVMSGEIGEIRLIRAAFGFPFRGNSDFRYNKELGGGALFDCGGYPVKLATVLLGNSLHVTDARFGYSKGFDVDMYGNVVLVNDSDITAQLAFGMDNSYKCELEIWGSSGCLKTERIFTPPNDYAPIISVEVGGVHKNIFVNPDDQFRNSLILFKKTIESDTLRLAEYDSINVQSELISVINSKKYK